MVSPFFAFVASISIGVTKIFDPVHFQRRCSYIAPVLKKELAPCSYRYKVAGKDRLVYIWYEAVEFDPSNDFIKTKKRYKCCYVKQIFDSSGKLLSEKRGTFCS